jgi:cell division inhibitor SepF
MDEQTGKPGFFERILGFVHRDEVEDFEEDRDRIPTTNLKVGHDHSHHLTVRQQVVSFQDAVAAADGLKRGESQVVNLAMAVPDMREKIKDFLCGVNYNAEGTFEEVGENVYLLTPSAIYVEVAPSAPASGQGRTFSSI